ncbi:uncharacterized protein AB9X84_020853 [Acanthopagrus schlegelii]
MEDFHINNTWQDYSFNYRNITSNYNDSSNITYSDPDEFHRVQRFSVRKDHVVPIYVINLLISDLIQFCCMIPLVTGSDKMFDIVLHIYLSSLMVSICFMVCIALERYLVIACPLWYRFRHTIKFSVVLCVVIWVRKDHVGPIYVINLLISDFIQLCCLIPMVTDSGFVMKLIIVIIYFYSLMVSICFMVCIALERYLLIACPLWYRFRHTIKFSVVLCVVVWVLSPVSYFMITFLIGLRNGRIIVGTFLLLPLPLFIFFLGGTIRALSASRVPSDEKRRIVGILVLVLLIYTLLFLPAIILCMTEIKDGHPLFSVANVFIQLSPLADLFLYVFMRKGTIDKLLASVCCCRMDSNDSSSSAV